ncbi:putative F-box domain-containing protein [Helianthus annuus]|nr:putative F-box domain-containing protein [Helianthus annuus]KAJ0747161.1 putative F-box domain-containing protein [Helianthus annuus]
METLLDEEEISCSTVVITQKMETLLGEEEEQSQTTDAQSDLIPNFSCSNVIIEEIFSRLPVQSILRSRSVCKPWHSFISDPSFTNFYFSRATLRLFLSAYNNSTRKRYFLSAAHDGGSVTRLITLGNTLSINDAAEAEHLNGLVCFTSANGRLTPNDAFVLNPSTRNIFKLPVTYGSSSSEVYTCYLFGFDESRNEHKVLNIRISGDKRFEPSAVEILIFSMSSYSWRKVNVELPIDVARDHLYFYIKRSVCVDSVIHFMLVYSFDILAFDLRTEKFSKISPPRDVVPRDMRTTYTWDGKVFAKYNHPRLIKINGCVGVVCHDRVVESNEMDIWMLQDYESCVWVKETVTFPESWIKLDGPFPLDSINTDEIIFSPSRLSRYVISVLIYNMKSRHFRSVQVTLKHPLCSERVEFDQIKCYVESIVPLQRNITRT